MLGAALESYSRTRGWHQIVKGRKGYDAGASVVCGTDPLETNVLNPFSPQLVEDIALPKSWSLAEDGQYCRPNATWDVAYTRVVTGWWVCALKPSGRVTVDVRLLLPCLPPKTPVQVSANINEIDVYYVSCIRATCDSRESSHVAEPYFPSFLSPFPLIFCVNGCHLGYLPPPRDDRTLSFVDFHYFLLLLTLYTVFD